MNPRPHGRAWIWFLPLVLAGSFILTPRAVASPNDPTAKTRGPWAHSEEHDPHVQMLELIGKVELRLREVDVLLQRAGAGEMRALDRVGPSSLDELLDASRMRSQDVVDSIDKILELANHSHPPGSSA